MDNHSLKFVNAFSNDTCITQKKFLEILRLMRQTLFIKICFLQKEYVSVKPSKLDNKPHLLSKSGKNILT